MLKLKSITWDKAPNIPGVRAGDLGSVNCLKPVAGLRGWRVAIKGAMVVLISPKGWKAGRQPREWNKEEPAVVWETPRSQVHLEWLSDEYGAEQVGPGTDSILSALTKGYISEPFGDPLEVEEAPVAKPINPAEIGDE